MLCKILIERIEKFPRDAFFARPNLIISEAISESLSTGKAKLMPEKEPVVEKIFDVIPTNSPFSLINAPPEFPGFTAASVCMSSRYGFPVFLLLALTIPDVTVKPSPNGLPIA